MSSLGRLALSRSNSLAALAQDKGIPIVLPPMATITPTSGNVNNSDGSGKIILDLPPLTESEVRTYIPTTGPAFVVGPAGDLLRGNVVFSAGNYTGKIVQNNSQVRTETVVNIAATDNPIILLTSPGASTADDTPLVAGSVVWNGRNVSGLTVKITVDGVDKPNQVTDASGNFSYEVTPALSSGAPHTIQVSIDAAAGSGNVTVITVGGFDADTTAYRDAVVAGGYNPSDSFLQAIDTLIRGMKADGQWDQLEVVVPMVVDKLAIRNLKKPTVAINPSVNFTMTAAGLVGSGSNGMGVGYNPGDGQATYKFLSGSNHFGVYCTAENGSTAYQFGVALSGNTKIRSRSGTNAAALNNQSSGGLTPAAGNAVTIPRHVTSVRRAADNVHRLFSNGVQTATQTTPSPSAVPNGAWNVFRTNSADYSAATIAFVHAGGELTDAQLLNQHNLIKAFLQTVGAVA